MTCDTPQLLLEGGVVACGLCLSCCKIKENADRQRRFYWLKKRRAFSHG